MLDVDLAALYGVPTGRLNEQVKRNRARFPVDFMFTLNTEEWSALMLSQIATTSQRRRRLDRLPRAFTEHGVEHLIAAPGAQAPLKDLRAEPRRLLSDSQ